MPLAQGRSRRVIGQNISKLRHEGRDLKQAIAIAMSEAGMARKKRKPIKKPKPKPGY